MQDGVFNRGWINRIVALAVLLCSALELHAYQTPAQSLAIESDKYLQSGQYDLAIAGYIRLLQLDPGSAGAWSNLGSAWFAKGNFAQASRSFAHASKLKPTNPVFAFNTALSYVRQDRCTKAETYLRTSVQSTTYRRGGHYLLGLCAFVSGHWSTSEKELLAAVDAGNRSAETFYMLAIDARKSGHTDGANRYYDLLQTSYPDSSFYHELAGQALDKANDDTAARRQLELAITTAPRAPGLHAQLGLLLWKSNRLIDAKKAFLDELDRDGKSYSALHYLGDIAEKSNSFEQALTWYQKALEAQPESAEAHFALGRVLENQGKSRAALKELQIAAAKEPNDVSVHYWSARAMKHLGSTQSAKMEMTRVQELLSAQRSAQLKLLGNGVE